MANINDYEDKDFFHIEKGIIHWHGYFYDGDGEWKYFRYSNFFTTLSDFVGKFHNSPPAAYESDGLDGNHYIEDISDDDIQAWLDDNLYGATPIDPKDITENTPDGYYVMTEF